MIFGQDMGEKQRERERDNPIIPNFWPNSGRPQAFFLVFPSVPLYPACIWPPMHALWLVVTTPAATFTHAPHTTTTWGPSWFFRLRRENHHLMLIFRAKGRNIIAFTNKQTNKLNKKKKNLQHAIVQNRAIRIFPAFRKKKLPYTTNDNKHTYYYYVSLFFTAGMPVRAPFPQFPLPIGRVRTWKKKKISRLRPSSECDSRALRLHRNRGEKIKLIPFNFSLSCVRKNLHGVEGKRTAAWNNTPQEHADLVLLCAIARPSGLVALACSSRLLGGIWNLQIFRVLRQLLHPREIQKFIHPAPPLPFSLYKCHSNWIVSPPLLRLFLHSAVYSISPSPHYAGTIPASDNPAGNIHFFIAAFSLLVCCALIFFFFSPFFQAPKPVASRFSKVVFFLFFFSILSFRRFFVFKFFPEFPVSASSFHKVWK